MQRPADDAKRFFFSITKRNRGAKYDGACSSVRSPRVNKNQQLWPAVSLLRRESSKHQERSLGKRSLDNRHRNLAVERGDASIQI